MQTLPTLFSSISLIFSRAVCRCETGRQGDMGTLNVNASITHYDEAVDDNPKKTFTPFCIIKIKKC